MAVNLHLRRPTKPDGERVDDDHTDIDADRG
jgi:hypothetical protein